MDKSKWRCTKADVGGGVWETTCEWLCGNQKVDIEEDDGQYVNDQSALGTYTAMTTPEQCDKGAHGFDGQNKDGLINENSAFDYDPKTNSAMLLGCTATCTVEPSFRCPLAADTAANDDWALNTCTDRCGDGIYDGPFPEITVPEDRSTAYPTCVT